MALSQFIIHYIIIHGIEVSCTDVLSKCRIPKSLSPSKITVEFCGIHYLLLVCFYIGCILDGSVSFSFLFDQQLVSFMKQPENVVSIAYLLLLIILSIVRHRLHVCYTPPHSTISANKLLAQHTRVLCGGREILNPVTIKYLGKDINCLID